MEKTAVQILIKRIENQIELSAHNKLGTNRTSDYRIGLQAALGFCFDALETEKEQIEVSWRNGHLEGLKDGVSYEVSDNTAEKYYSQNYKQD